MKPTFILISFFYLLCFFSCKEESLLQNSKEDKIVEITEETKQQSTTAVSAFNLKNATGKNSKPEKHFAHSIIQSMDEED